MPVAIAPTMPPTQWMPNTSRLSSYPSAFLTLEQATKQTAPTTSPSTPEPIGPAQPAAGGTATRPAIAPDSRPGSDGLPCAPHSTNNQGKPAAAVATNVLIIASAVLPLASRLEPALNPNQPTHSRAAPISVIVSECGAIR